MNKKLLYTALAAGLVLPLSANAGVKVYGAAQVELSSYSDETGSPVDQGAATTGIAPDDTLKEDDNGRGRFGVKASEDLGGGLKGIAKFEWKTDSTVSGPLGGREFMVGLKGGFGTIGAGDMKGAYKYAGGVKYDPFVTTAMEARTNGGMSGKVGLNSAYGHNGFIDKSVGYWSPKVNGLQMYFTYRLDEGGLTEKDGGYTVSVKYNNGPIEAFVAAADDDETLGGATSYSATKVGGYFKTGALKFLLQYEMIDNVGVDETIIFLGAHFKSGKNTFVLQIAQNDVDDVLDIDAGTYMALGLIHKFTKKTRVFVGYRSYSDGENVFSVGMRKDFSS